MGLIADIQALYPEGLGKVRIAFNSVTSEAAKKVIVELFSLDATIVVSDRNRDSITGLNRILFERSGSAFRYRSVPFDQIHKEPVEVFVQLEDSLEGATYETAKHHLVRYKPKGETKPAENTPGK